MGVASYLTFCIKRLLTRGEKRFVTKRLGEWMEHTCTRAWDRHR